MLVSKGLQGFSSVRLRREVHLAGALALDGLERVARGKALGTIAKLPLTESDLFHGSAERIPGDGGVLLERGDVKPCLGNRREDLADAVVELHGLGRGQLLLMATYVFRSTNRVPSVSKYGKSTATIPSSRGSANDHSIGCPSRMNRRPPGFSSEFTTSAQRDTLGSQQRAPMPVKTMSKRAPPSTSGAR